MKIEDLEIGKCYSRGDDALYKVVAKGEGWVCVLHYSHNHYVCTVEICNEDELYMEGMKESTEEWEYEIFEELRYSSWNTITNK